MLHAGVVGEGGPVEAVQLVVEDPGEGEVQGGGPAARVPGEGERGPLLVLVEGDGEGARAYPPSGSAVVELGEGDLELGGVEDDRRCRPVDGHVDLDVAGEGGRREVRGQHQPVGVGPDRAGRR